MKKTMIAVCLIFSSFLLLPTSRLKKIIMKKLLLKVTVFSLAIALCGTSCKKVVETGTSGLPDIDLAAESINFSIERVVSQFDAVVKIEAVVKNVGR